MIKKKECSPDEKVVLALVRARAMRYVSLYMQYSDWGCPQETLKCSVIKKKECSPEEKVVLALVQARAMRYISLYMQYSDWGCPQETLK